MKTRIALVLTAVLTASLLTGCGCTNRNIENTKEPTVLPTNEEIWNTTENTTIPTTRATDPSVGTPHETTDNTTASTTVPDSTTDTAPADDNMASRARRMLPEMR